MGFLMRLLAIMACVSLLSACGSASYLDAPIKGHPDDARLQESVPLPDGPLQPLWEHSLDGYAGRSEILRAGDYALLPSIAGIIDIVNVRSGRQTGRINVKGYLHAAPVVVSDRLYAVSLAEQSTLQCHSLDDASLLWSAGIEASDAPVCVSGDKLFVVGRHGNVQCFGLNDSIPRWTRHLPGDFSAGLVAEDSLLFACGANGDLTALSIVSGAVRWTQASGEAILVAPAVRDGLVCVVTREGKVVATEAHSGVPRFVRSFGEQVHVSPLITPQGIIVALSGGDIVWLDADDGRELRRVSTGRLPGASPLPAADGVLLLAREGRLLTVRDGADQVLTLASLKLRSNVRPLLTEHGVILLDEEGNATLFGKHKEKGSVNADD
jgi:outer membrane protein assembly factor BamB